MWSTRGVDATTKGRALVQASAGRRVNNKVRAIVNVASKLGILVAGAIGPYAVSRAGVIWMIKMLAVEGARSGIHLKPVATSCLATELSGESFETAVGPAFIGRARQGCVGPLDDFDGPLLLLLGEAGSFVTGQHCYCQRGPSRFWPMMA
jgi:NAD(P)-dependent dehydrogenase (short-subunit alcohol dehydrogenase family)